MAIGKREPVIELINVHQVRGDKDAIIFLKEAEHEYVERLFYTAKKYGRSEFMFREDKYEILRNKDFSFTIQISPEQELYTEQLA